MDRNICNFLWYSVVASEGLRSDGVDDLPLSKSQERVRACALSCPSPAFYGPGFDTPRPAAYLGRSVNYVSLRVLRYAAAELADAEATGRRVSCMWQPSGATEAPQCGREAEYLVPDATRVSAGGEIEVAALWFCREHLELELGGPVKEQPLVWPRESPEEVD